MRHSKILIAALLSLAPTAAFAHPHIFVEARLEVVAGKDGSVEELRNVWRFDEVFSSSVVLQPAGTRRARRSAASSPSSKAAVIGWRKPKAAWNSGSRKPPTF